MRTIERWGTESDRDMNGNLWWSWWFVDCYGTRRQSRMPYVTLRAAREELDATMQSHAKGA